MNIFGKLLGMKINPALGFFIQLLPFGSEQSRHNWAVKELTKRGKGKIDPATGKLYDADWAESKIDAIDDVIRLLEQK